MKASEPIPIYLMATLSNIDVQINKIRFLLTGPGDLNMAVIESRLKDIQLFASHAIELSKEDDDGQG